LSWALLFVSLAVTPQWSLDPINPIKMLLMAALAFSVLGVILANRKEIDWSGFKIVFGISILFFAWQLVAFFFSRTSYLSQLFGVNGRNTGLITYTAFVLLMLGSAIASSAMVMTRIYGVAALVGVASVSYGALQASGVEPLPWVNPYSPVLGFLGNPNFQSSFLGIIGTLAFSHLLVSNFKTHYRAAISVYLLVTLYVIKETNSQQGFLVLLIGISVILFLYFRSRFGKLLNFSYWILIGIGFTSVLSGSLNKGVFASLLYKDSVTYRGDYWRAGWKMTVDHPIFGVGLDNFGDWYRRSRTVEATIRRGPDVVSNAAHNVYLDISSNGGFPLMIIYICLMGLVVTSAWKVIRRSKSVFNAPFAGLVGAWVAFQAQSIISINQIGLAIWGWIFSGLIIGYEINTRNIDKSEERKGVGRVDSKGTQSSPATILAIFVGLLFGASVSMSPYIASVKYKSALETSNAGVIENSAYIWPIDSSRMIQVAITLNDNKLESKALTIALDAVERFPDSFRAWDTLNKMKSATQPQKAQALKEMKRLDPLNPNLK
jgi:O-antigen ligase